MKLKNEMEVKLKESGIPYTIFRLTGFYQGLIEQYAIPILESLPIWLPMRTHIFHIWIPRYCKVLLASITNPQTTNQTFLLGGSRAWVSSEIINLCEQLAGQQAKLNASHYSS
jgi:uncharacterized protein YbjT (DUF2867 family)